MAAGQVGCAAALGLLALPLVLATPLRTAAGSRALVAPSAALLALGVLGTGLAYVWNARVIAAGARWPRPDPVVGVVAGALVMGERLSWATAAGAAVVVTGLWVAQRGRRR